VDAWRFPPRRQILVISETGGNAGIALTREFFFDQDEVVANEIENLFSGQKSDGQSPS